MEVRESAVAAVLAWVTAECWASPWNLGLQPHSYWIALFVVFVIMFALGVRRSTRRVGIDLALISIGSTLAASWLWSLWMWRGWFSWEWLGWLAQATGSDGEGAYRMIEYQFFLLVFGAAIAAWFCYLKISKRDASAL